MTKMPDRALIADLEESVRTTAGVSALFPTGGIVSKVLDLGAQLVGVRRDDAPLIRWEPASDGARVEVAIGVYAVAGAVDTSSRVRDAIDALCAERGFPCATIHLTIVHVDDGEPA